MKRALCEVSGRIAQVAVEDFPVAPPLVWRDCPDAATAETYYFDGTTVVPLPPQPPLSPAVVAEQQRQATFDAAIAADVNLQQFKTMDKAAFDVWWAANVTNAAQAIAVLKKLTWLLIRYLLR